MNYQFDTPTTPTLHVEITAGELEMHTHDSPTVDVTLEPMSDPDRAAELIDQIRVEQRGDTVSVVYPKGRSRLFGDRSEVRTIVHTPVGTRASVRSQSADVRGTGSLGETDVAVGSGDVQLEHTAALRIRSGSGDLRVTEIAGSAEAKTGSGDIALAAVHGSATVSTGSGDVKLGTIDGEATVKAASGDVTVEEPGDALLAATASGDLSVRRVRRGTVRTRAVSGDVRIGVVDGVPVLLDVTTVTGAVRSQLEATDAPADGQGAHITVQTTTGDINLVRV